MSERIVKNLARNSLLMNVLPDNSAWRSVGTGDTRFEEEGKTFTIWNVVSVIIQ